MYAEKIISRLLEDFKKTKSNFRNFLIENNIRPSKYRKSKLFKEIKSINVSFNKKLLNENDKGETTFDYAFLFFKNDLLKNHPFNLTRKELNLLLEKYNIFELFHEKYGISLKDALSEDVMPIFNNSDFSMDEFDNDKAELFNILIMNNINPSDIDNNALKKASNEIINDYKKMTGNQFIDKYGFPKFMLSQTVSNKRKKITNVTPNDFEDYPDKYYKTGKYKKSYDDREDDEVVNIDVNQKDWENHHINGGFAKPAVKMNTMSIPSSLLNKDNNNKNNKNNKDNKDIKKHKHNRHQLKDIYISDYEKLLNKYQDLLMRLEEKEFSNSSIISAYRKDPIEEENWGICSGIVSSMYLLLNSHPETPALLNENLSLKRNTNLDISNKLGKSWTLTVFNSQVLFTDIRLPLANRDLYKLSYSAVSTEEKQMKKRINASNDALKIVNKAIENVINNKKINSGLRNELFIEPVFTKDLQESDDIETIMNVITKSLMIELHSLPEISYEEKESSNTDKDINDLFIKKIKKTEKDADNKDIEVEIEEENTGRTSFLDNLKNLLKDPKIKTKLKTKSIMQLDYDELSGLSKEIIKPYKNLFE